MKLHLIGGFLGSGKTTAIQHACPLLVGEGKRVAVVTNDQGSQLVDGGFIESLDIPSKEVRNGCFCCNYQQLYDHVQSLKEREDPDVIFAESVGSCADLVATIAKPFEKFHSQISIVISVFADAYLLLTLIKGNACFLDEKVQYIYKKQLEEADVLVVNKVDLLSAEELLEVQEIIAVDYRTKTVLYQNSLDKDSIRQWIAAIDNHAGEDRKSLDLDYDIYAQGEAMLGWLDKEILILSEDQDAYKVAVELISTIHKKIQNRNYPIGHLKVLLNDGSKKIKISFTNTGNDLDKIGCGEKKVSKLSVLINARIQAEPEALEQLVTDSISEARNFNSCSVTQLHAASFKPGYPRPTHRITE